MNDPLDDLDQILDEADKTTSSRMSANAKQGRRATKKEELEPQRSAHTPDFETVEGSSSSKKPSRSEQSSAKPRDDPESGPPKKGKRTGGWGEERRPSVMMEDERLKMRTPSPASGSDSEFPVIPNLEETVEEDVVGSIAMAPTIAVNRVATYRELDNDLLQHAQFMTLDNEVDLKLLGKCLSNEADVKEEDKPWDWDRLFTEVSSDLLTEWAEDEKLEGGDQEAPSLGIQS